MKEFFLNYICTTPPYTVAACEFQYNWLVPIGAVTLIGVAVSLIVVWIHWRKATIS